MATKLLHAATDTFRRSAPFSSVTDIKICDGGSATIDAGPGKETYLWNTGETTQSDHVTQSGDYWVKVSREDCVLSDTVHMSVGTGHVELGPDVEICPNATSNVDGGENFSWLWSDGTTGQYLKTTVIGKHWVSVFDDYGCEASDTIMVNAYTGVVDPLVDIKLNYCKCRHSTRAKHQCGVDRHSSRIDSRQ
jgi:hypothetical protein